jgi:hypothetical protein
LGEIASPSQSLAILTSTNFHHAIIGRRFQTARFLIAVVKLRKLLEFQNIPNRFAWVDCGSDAIVGQKKLVIRQHVSRRIPWCRRSVRATEPRWLYSVRWHFPLAKKAPTLDLA